MASDKRLLTMRNLSTSKAGKVSPQTYEFEVYVEVPVRGEFHNGPFKLVEWDTEDGAPGVQRSLVLTIDSYLAEVPAPGKPTAKGFYHALSMPEEFCALATTLLRRRVALGALLRRNGMPLRLKPRPPRPHDAVLAGVLDLAALDPWIERVSSLSDDYHQMFILACRMYQEALALIDAKPDLAYLLLVSCIEVFVGRLGRRNKEEDLAQPFKDALAACPDGAARALLLQRMLQVDRGITRHFADFILENVGEEFWAASPKLAPEKGRIEVSELPILLNRIYDARSNLVHEAEPLPPNVFDPPADESEIDRRVELKVGERRWTQKQFIPYARFFERLVQHVLTSFLRNSVATPGG